MRWALRIQSAHSGSIRPALDGDTFVNNRISLSDIPRDAAIVSHQGTAGPGPEPKPERRQHDRINIIYIRSSIADPLQIPGEPRRIYGVTSPD